MYGPDASGQSNKLQLSPILLYTGMTRDESYQMETWHSPQFPSYSL